MQFMREFLLAFIPLFVAVDAIGTLSLVTSLTEGLAVKSRQKVVRQAVMTAVILAVLFIFCGTAVFKFLNITMADFMIAGGVILFSLALLEMFSVERKRLVPADSQEDVGVVPIGTPLIVGPAVLTTSLLLASEVGLVPTLTALVLNILLAGIVFSSSEWIVKVFGRPGTRAFSKVTILFLAAIGVRMVRKGVLLFLVGH